ncbi:MAG: CPBP family glutamic-type intramembrane protease [Cyanobacteriota bacterium]|nr:CPBP family glutamic-type intramembrane protease [Cyanobacteriota bacterium]
MTPTISMQQQEMALLADQAVPAAIRPLLVGEDPTLALQEALGEIPLSQMNDRQRLLLAGLQSSEAERRELLAASVQSPLLIPLEQALLASKQEGGLSLADREALGSLSGDPLLQQVGCFALGGDRDDCVNPRVASSMALRLVLSVVLPAAALLAGTALLLRHLWMLLRKSVAPWPPLQALPLSLTDMVLLIACGFVVLGEVIAPAFVAPLSALMTRGMDSPLSKALTLVIGYGALALPPLLILRQQLRSLQATDRPVDGWLQWRLQPWGSALLKAGRGWLMVMPLVLLTGWLMGLLLGDQGGSNPLLELVLRSKDPLALMLLATTAVILAPLFEELVFRGALLPVLAKSFGPLWGVVTSALVFGVAHLSVGELPPLFVLGLGLGLLRLSSGRLLPCVLMHALWNGVTFINLLLLGG